MYFCSDMFALVFAAIWWWGRWGRLCVCVHVRLDFSVWSSVPFLKARTTSQDIRCGTPKGYAWAVRHNECKWTCRSGHGNTHWPSWTFSSVVLSTHPQRLPIAFWRFGSSLSWREMWNSQHLKKMVKGMWASYWKRFFFVRRWANVNWTKRELGVCTVGVWTTFKTQISHWPQLSTVSVVSLVSCISLGQSVCLSFLQQRCRNNTSVPFMWLLRLKDKKHFTGSKYFISHPSKKEKLESSSSLS